MKALAVGTALIVIGMMYALLSEETGLQIWRALRADLVESRARVSVLALENESLREEIALLEDRPDALERAIREDLGLALPGEVVVRFGDPDRGGLSADPTGSWIQGRAR